MKAPSRPQLNDKRSVPVTADREKRVGAFLLIFLLDIFLFKVYKLNSLPAGTQKFGPEAEN